MIVLFRAVVLIIVALSISCSRGGTGGPESVNSAGDQKKTQSPEAKNVDKDRQDQPNNPAEDDSTQSLVLFSAVGCQGKQIIYTAKMDCALLVNAGNVSSAMIEGKCQNAPRPTSALAICQAWNNEINR